MPGGAVPAVGGCFGHTIRLKSNCSKAAAALRRERIGQEPAISHLTPNADRPGVEAAAHVRIAGVGTAAVDLQRLIVHLMTGLGRAGNSDAHRLRFSGNAQTDGKLVEFRPGVVPVVPVNVGAGLLKRNGDGLQFGHQTGGDTIYTVEPAVAVLCIRKNIVPALIPQPL